MFLKKTSTIHGVSSKTILKNIFNNKNQKKPNKIVPVTIYKFVFWIVKSPELEKNIIFKVHFLECLVYDEP